MSTAEQIKHMVDRFLGWRLPENFRPDNGISFKPTHSEEYMASRGKPPMRHDPVGTNLFDAVQAEAMVRYMLEGLPPSGSAEVLAEDLLALNHAMLDERGALRTLMWRLILAAGGKIVLAPQVLATSPGRVQITRSDDPVSGDVVFEAIES
jgi:hypothetical protein